MTRHTCVVLLLALFAISFGCTSTPRPDTEVDREVLDLDAQAAIEDFKRVDPSMEERFENARAYAVFPEVDKGAVGVGGAYGRGLLYENGQPVGYADLSQATIGAQLGGQTYSEVIFFQNDIPLRNFKNDTLEFAAQASAVAASEGASEDANYESGVLVFTMARGGLMFEASIGGQRFRFEPFMDDDDDFDDDDDDVMR